MVSNNELTALRAQVDAGHKRLASMSDNGAQEEIAALRRDVAEAERDERRLALGGDPQEADAVTSRKIVRERRLVMAEQARNAQGEQRLGVKQEVAAATHRLQQTVRAYFNESAVPTLRKADEHIDAAFREVEALYPKAAALSKQWGVGVAGPDNQWEALNAYELALGRPRRQSPPEVAQREALLKVKLEDKKREAELQRQAEIKRLEGLVRSGEGGKARTFARERLKELKW